MINQGVNIYYSDTDSILTYKPLSLVPKELGKLKDEFDGKIIQEAYFLVSNMITGTLMKIIRDL